MCYDSFNHYFIIKIMYLHELVVDVDILWYTFREALTT